MRKWHGSLTVILYGLHYQILTEMSDLVTIWMASHFAQVASVNSDIRVFLNMIANAQGLRTEALLYVRFEYKLWRLWFLAHVTRRFS